jgi:hypothetical protein
LDGRQYEAEVLSDYPPQSIEKIQYESVIRVDVTDIVRDTIPFSIRVSVHGECTSTQILFLDETANIHVSVKKIVD